MMWLSFVLYRIKIILAELCCFFLKGEKSARFLHTLFLYAQWKEYVANARRTAILIDFDYEERKQLYGLAHELTKPDGSIDYLEFGVWKGDSMRVWLGLSKDPGSRFYGFDSFEGLPESWKNLKAGDLSVDGKLPDIDDERVTWVKGWFKDTLPQFVKTYDPKNKLVIHIDSDLYSSALYVLMYLDPFIKPGTVLLFDDFSDIHHEFAAFKHYLRASLKQVECMATRRNGLDKPVFVFV